MAPRAMSWKMDTSVLGLSLLTVNVGLSGMKQDAAGVASDVQTRAMIEAAALATTAAVLSRNWWPLVFPVVYLAADYVWSTQRGHAPQVLADTDNNYLE